MENYHLLFKKKGDFTCSHVSFFPLKSCSRLHLQSEEYCILHSKNPNKDKSCFSLAIKEKLADKDYDFSNIFFPAAVSFVEQKFEGPVSFNGAIFSGGAYFQRAKFNEPSTFEGTTFKSGAIFTGSIFLKEANFQNAIFEFGPFFDKVTFSNKTNLKSVKFFRKVIFTDTHFGNEVYFNETVFKKIVLFDKAIFSEKSSFWKVIFCEGASFIKVIFAEVSFDLVRFSSGVSFTWAKFEKDSYFSGTIFDCDSSFEMATFYRDTIFDGVNFLGKTIFSEVLIKGRMFFYLINAPEIKGKQKFFRAEMNPLRMDVQSILRFQDLSLSHVEFNGTDLLRPEFRNINWYSYHARQIVYDEVLINKKEPSFLKKLYFFLRNKYYGPSKNEYARVEELYRYLKLNYEREGDYKQAGDFHYGEMEMHRRASKWRCFPFYWYSLYWSLSGYGERPSRALGWLVIFLAVFTGLLAWAGLDLDPKFSAGFGDSFFYLLQKVTLQRPTWAEPQGFWGKLVAGLSVLLIPGQAALFLLALRNRLGRRR